MKKIALMLVLITLISLSMSGCLSDKSKLIGTWRFSEGGTITFFENNTVTIANVGPLVAIQLDGVFTYTLSDHNLTFARGSPIGITVTLAYNFPNDTTLVLSNNQIQLTLTKAS